MEATRVDDIRPKKFLHQLRLENKKMGIYNKLLAGCVAFVVLFSCVSCQHVGPSSD
jgi:hypothetical protein